MMNYSKPGSVAHSPAPRVINLRNPSFVPSSYQQAIFEWLVDGSESAAFVNACAGSGKTTTLVEAAYLLPAHLRSLFAAFNKHIADELRDRLPGHVEASTIHALGLRAVKQWSRNRRRDYVSRRKYRQIAYDIALEQGIEAAQASEIQLEVELLVNFFRLCLPQGDPADWQALDTLVTEYGIDIADRYLTYELLPLVLKRGLAQARTVIDFTDMLWLPLKLNLPCEKYDRVFTDEAQDFNVAQRELLLRHIAPGGRSLWVGDRNQSIYAFSGADTQAVDRIIAATSAVELPLSICYRCPSSHVELAQALVPKIEAAPDAMEGVLVQASWDDARPLMTAGSLILCRTTSPLIRLCFSLIAGGIGAKVRGRDIGEQLVRQIRKVADQPGFQFAAFSVFLNEWYKQQRTRLLEKDDSAMAIESLTDRYECIHSISVSSRATSLEELCRAAQDLFSDDKPTVTLSTIHRAKGLEADRVFLIRPELLPHPKATKPSDRQQEANLEYVAKTRSKHELYIVHGVESDAD